MLTEDQRQAAATITSISTIVTTATLASLAGLIALFTYLSQTYKVDGQFYAVVIASAISLVASVFCGGRGTANLAAELAGSKWTIEGKAPFYVAQKWFALIGLALIVAGALVGVNSARITASPPDRNVQRIANSVQALERDVRHRQSRNAHMRKLERAEDGRSGP